MAPSFLFFPRTSRELQRHVSNIQKTERFSTNNTADSKNLSTKESNGQFRAGRQNMTGRIFYILLSLKCYVGKTSVSDDRNKKGGDDRAEFY